MKHRLKKLLIITSLLAVIGGGWAWDDHANAGGGYLPPVGGGVVPCNTTNLGNVYHGTLGGGINQYGWPVPTQNGTWICVIALNRATGALYNWVLTS